jgi:hypothetical protein
MFRCAYPLGYTGEVLLVRQKGMSVCLSVMPAVGIGAASKKQGLRHVPMAARGLAVCLSEQDTVSAKSSEALDLRNSRLWQPRDVSFWQSGTAGRATYLLKPPRRRLRSRRGRAMRCTVCSGLPRIWPPSCARCCRASEQRDELAPPHGGFPSCRDSGDLRLSHSRATPVMHNSKFGGQCLSWGHFRPIDTTHTLMACPLRSDSVQNSARSEMTLATSRHQRFTTEAAN